jgi:hypothetical protein
VKKKLTNRQDVNGLKDKPVEAMELANFAKPGTLICLTGRNLASIHIKKIMTYTHHSTGII